MRREDIIQPLFYASISSISFTIMLTCTRNHTLSHTHTCVCVCVCVKRCADVGSHLKIMWRKMRTTKTLREGTSTPKNQFPMLSFKFSACQTKMQRIIYRSKLLLSFLSPNPKSHFHSISRKLYRDHYFSLPLSRVKRFDFFR